MTIPTSFNRNYLNYSNKKESSSRKRSIISRLRHLGSKKNSPGSINSTLDRSLVEQQVFDEKRRLLQPNLLDNDLDADTISFNSTVSSNSSSNNHSPGSSKKAKPPQIIGPISAFLYFAYNHLPSKITDRFANKNSPDKNGVNNSNPANKSSKSHKKHISDLTSKMMSYYNYNSSQNFNGEIDGNNPANYLIDYNGYNNNNNDENDEISNVTGADGDFSDYNGNVGSVPNDVVGSNNINIMNSQGNNDNIRTDNQRMHGLIKFFQNYDHSKKSSISSQQPGQSVGININTGSTSTITQGTNIVKNMHPSGSYMGSSYANGAGESYQSHVNIMNIEPQQRKILSEEFGGSSVLQFAAEKYQQIFMSPPNRFNNGEDMMMGNMANGRDGGRVLQFFRNNTEEEEAFSPTSELNEMENDNDMMGGSVQ